MSGSSKLRVVMGNRSIREFFHDQTNVVASITRQLVRYHQLGYPQTLGWSPQQCQALENALVGLATARSQTPSFVLVVFPARLLSLSQQLSLVRFNDRPGGVYQDMDPGQISHLVDPDTQWPYVLWGLDDQKEMRGQNIEDTLRLARAFGRFGLTADEAVGLAVQYPDIFQDWDVYAMGSVLGGGERAPMLSADMVHPGPAALRLAWADRQSSKNARCLAPFMEARLLLPADFQLAAVA